MPGVDQTRLLPLATRLTPRDYHLFDLLLTHRTLTTHHIAALLFTGPAARNARRRLLTLHRLELLDRWRPLIVHGTAPHHWILAPLGAHLLALHHDTTPDELGYRPDRAQAIAHNSRRGHILGLADTYTAFVLAARTTPGATLERWRGEDDCARRWGAHVRPDAYLRWRQHGAALRAFLEYDTGSQNLARVAAKLRDYARLAQALERPCPVLITTSTPQREADLAHTLRPATGPATPVWLTTHDQLHTPGPAAPIWTDPHHSERQPLHRLAEPPTP